MTFPFTLYKHLIYIHIHKYLHNPLLFEAALTVALPEPWQGASCTHLRLGLLFFHPADPQRSSQAQPNSDSDRGGGAKTGEWHSSADLSIPICKLGACAEGHPFWLACSESLPSLKVNLGGGFLFFWCVIQSTFSARSFLMSGSLQKPALIAAASHILKAAIPST